MQIYLDNNIYNYLVDGKSYCQNDIEKFIDAINSNKIEVLFSPINLFEIIRCYENKKEKAKKMIEISYKINKKIIKLPDEILLEQLILFKNKKDSQNVNLYNTEETRFDKIRTGILNIENFIIPEDFHIDIKKFDCQYQENLMKMKDYFYKTFFYGINDENYSVVNTDNHINNRIDFFELFNSDDECRKMFTEVIFKEKSGYTENLPYISNFDDIPCFSIFLKFYFKVAYELIISGKIPKSGDWADLDQTIYFNYVDYIITSDTGKAGTFTNYREILNQILQPINKQAIKFSTLINKIEKL